MVEVLALISLLKQAAWHGVERAQLWTLKDLGSNPGFSCVALTKSLFISEPRFVHP